MISRAHLLITREVELFNQNKPWGISLEPVNTDSIFEWFAKIHGLKDSKWQDGIFRLYIKFDENFNVRPPKIVFHTIPFHPNIDMVTGRPCLTFLDDWSQWKSTYSLTFILVSLQYLLSNPILQNPINLEAVRMMKEAPKAYEDLVEDCVIASQRVEVCQKFNDDSASPQRYTNLTAEDVSEKKKESFKEHYALMFGRNNSNSDRQAERAEQLARMKQVYLPIPPPLRTPDAPFMSPNIDPDESEVDELMAWTRSLTTENNV